MHQHRQAVVGDRVLWQAPPENQGDEGIVEKVLERRNLFYRQDEIRTKSFAANLDQILILVAAEPEFSAHQLARALVAAEALDRAGLAGATVEFNNGDVPVDVALAAYER